jgi:hypothetical protein
MQKPPAGCFSGFSRHPAEFLWYLQDIRGKLKLNRTTFRLIHKVPKE